MPAKARRNPSLPVTAATLVVLTCVSCTLQQRTPTRPQQQTTGADSAHLVHADGDIEIAAHGVRARFSPRIDRLVSFGPDGRHVNLLHTVDLDRPVPISGEYTFFGGAYSWWAPQNGPLGWTGPDGAPRPWPPEPAMDIGPAQVVQHTRRSFTMIGPALRNGLREEKRFRVMAPYRAELRYALVNTSESTVTAGPWLNTAVAPGEGSVLAFRTWPGRPGEHPGPLEVWGGMGEDAVSAFRRALDEPESNGWAALPLSRATWNDGIKVYLDAGDAPAEIAVWRDGWWLHRRLDRGNRQSHRRLRELGEGPVAAYLNPDLGIVEAELVAPITDIAPGEAAVAVEQWTLIRSATPDVKALPGPLE